MKPITLACLLLAVSSVFAFDEPVRPPKGTTCGDSILAFYEEGPNFANAAQVYPEHAKYITDLLGQGKAAAAGKMKDANKALIIVRTKDIAEAQAWVSQDPFVQKGVVKASFMAWAHCWAPGISAPDMGTTASR